MLDIPLSFVTGVYIDSILVMNPRRVARHYMRTWFIADVFVTSLSCASLPETLGSASTLFRYIRILRFLRIIRLFKVRKMFNDTLELLNSSVILLVASIAKLAMT